MNNKVSKMVSKLIVEAAVQTAKMPNQSCPLLFGEAHSDMKLQSEDYQKWISFMKEKH